MSRFAEIVVNTPVHHVRARDAEEGTYTPAGLTFHYRVPPHLADTLRPGHLVRVPFRDREVHGIVIALHDQSPVPETREVHDLVYPQPVLTPTQLTLARWIADTCLAPLLPCLKLFLPPQLTAPPEPVLALVPGVPLPDDLTPEQRLLLERLKKGPRAERDLKVGGKNLARPAVVQPLIAGGIVRRTHTVARRPPRARTEDRVRLIADDDTIAHIFPQLGRASKRADVLAYLLAIPDPLPTVEQVSRAVGCTLHLLKEMEKARHIALTPAVTRIIFLPPSPSRAQPPASPEGTDHPDPARLDSSSAILAHAARLGPRAPVQARALKILAQAGGGVTLADLKARGVEPRVLRELLRRFGPDSDTPLLQAVEDPATVHLTLDPEQAQAHIIALRGTQVHRRVLEALQGEEDPVWVGWLYAETGANRKVLRDLEQAGLIAIEREETYRDPLAGKTFPPEPFPTLTPDQARVWEEIEATLTDTPNPQSEIRNPKSASESANQRISEFVVRHSQSPIPNPQSPIPPPPPPRPADQLTDRPTDPSAIPNPQSQIPHPVFLLHGVTGSGKTEIYMRAIDHVLRRGGQALLLVPEIALTPQTVQRFAARFPGRLTVWHSDLSVGERFDIWRRAMAGEIDLIIGTRSALFAPLPRLRLIILDEEHDESYKNGRIPYYHARDVAIALAGLVNATVILGSATPDIVTYTRAREGTYRLLQLPQRIIAHRRHLEAMQQQVAHTPANQKPANQRISEGRISESANSPFAIRHSPSPTPNPKSEIRNPQSPIPNPQSAIRNAKSETRNPKSETPTPQPEPRPPLTANHYLLTAEPPWRPLGPDFPDARTIPLPPVRIVDMRLELKAGNRSIFSRALQQAMHQALSAGQQVILFINRRGRATFILCRDCGHVLKCDRCDVPLTFHLTHPPSSHTPNPKSQIRNPKSAIPNPQSAIRNPQSAIRNPQSSPPGILLCHHCNRRYPVPESCLECGSPRIRYFGGGTQRVEAEVHRLFPHARVLRWDRDVTTTRGAHWHILEAFASHEADVLIGTQMLAKGLDLPRVTLVGVVSADVGLFLPDYRTAERTFQVLTQVAGRAGRGLWGGRVIVQTYNPQHYAIRAAAHHDYAQFYKRELAFRREATYPPFSRLVRLLYTHTRPRQAQQEAERLAADLRDEIERRGFRDITLIGPAPCFFARIRGQYRWQILLRGPDPTALLRHIPLPLGWRADVDPVNTL